VSELRDRIPEEPQQNPIWPARSQAGDPMGPPPPVPGRRHGAPWRPGPIGISIAVASVLVVLGLCAALVVPMFASRIESPYQHPVEAASATPSEVPTPMATANPSSTSTTGAPDEQVLSMINAERAKARCPALRSDDRLRTSANDHSTDMATRNYFSKKGRDGSSPADRMTQAGYDRPLDENIAMGQRSTRQVVDGWMHSRSDKANIVDCAARAIGVSVAYRGSTAYWTVDFGE
jgi:uncharacterized protein YkwD